MNAGVVYAALAFLWWGLFPLYFRLVPGIPSGEVLAHRIVWCLVLLAATLSWRRQWGWLAPVLRQPKVLAAFVASALLLSANWLTYIWSVNHGHVVDASLGYFITPLVNVLLGYTLLHERPRRAQWFALALATLGVIWLTAQTGRLPWIALVLAATFGCYGLLRKIAVLGALEGLTLETLVLAPLALAALGFWMAHDDATFPAPDMLTNLWLFALGPITAVPLLMFAAGARRIPLTTLGLLQYIGPSIQFVLGLWVFHEPFTPARLAGFVLIWLALAVYTADGWFTSRRDVSPVPQGAK
ncbi:MAG TPA: EamA family transporter RarD [Burkholderiaceae bacterium]